MADFPFPYDAPAGVQGAPAHVRPEPAPLFRHGPFVTGFLFTLGAMLASVVPVVVVFVLLGGALAASQ